MIPSKEFWETANRAWDAKKQAHAKEIYWGEFAPEDFVKRMQERNTLHIEATGLNGCRQLDVVDKFLEETLGLALTLFFDESGKYVYDDPEKRRLFLEQDAAIMERYASERHCHHTHEGFVCYCDEKTA